MPHLLRLIKSIPRETVGEIKVPPPTDQKIIDKAAEWGAEKVAATLSDQLHKDYIGSMKAAAILKSAEARYRKPLEDLGWEWEDFLEQAIEYGFEKVQLYERLMAWIRIMDDVKL
jgi:hypothetical protein